MIVLARLLSPDDFGIIGLAGFSVSLLNVVSEIGVGSALIQKQGADDQDLNVAWTLGLGRSVVLFAVLYTSAGMLGDYFGHAALKPVLRIMALGVILDAMANIGVICFRKELSYKQTAQMDIIANISDVVATVVIALLYRTYWAIVIGGLIGRIAFCYASYRFHPFRPRMVWDSKRATHLMNFGKHIFWISTVTFVVTNADDALVGKLLGLSSLGYYSMAFNMANLPVSGIAAIIGGITFAAYSLMQNDRRRLNDGFRRVLDLVLILFVPAIAMILLLADDLVIVFLGVKWMPVADPLRILMFMGFFRGLANVMAPLHLAVNQPGIQSRIKTVEMLSFLILLYPLTRRWGIIGTCWAVTIVYLISFVMNSWSTVPLINDFVRVFCRSMVSPLASALAFCLTAGLLRMAFVDIALPVRLAVSGAGGLAVMVVFLWMTSRRHIMTMIGRL